MALHADPKCVIFKPDCLTFEESWNLFQRISFPFKDTIGKFQGSIWIFLKVNQVKLTTVSTRQYDPFEYACNWCCVKYKVDDEMEEMCKQMIKHCGGYTVSFKSVRRVVSSTIHTAWLEKGLWE